MVPADEDIKIKESHVSNEDTNFKKRKQKNVAPKGKKKNKKARKNKGSTQQQREVCRKMKILVECNFNKHILYAFGNIIRFLKEA